MKIFLEIHRIIQVLLVILLWFKSTPRYFFRNLIIATNKLKIFLFLDKNILQWLTYLIKINSKLKIVVAPHK